MTRLYLTNLLLVCRPFHAILLCVCVGKLLCSLSGSGRADQASWEPPVGLGYSREKTRVLAGQLKSYVSFIEHRICLYLLLHPVLFVIYHIYIQGSAQCALRTVKAIRYF